MNTRTRRFASLRGRVVAATYHEDPDFPEFAGNRFYEALPPVTESEDEVADILATHPAYSPADRRLSAMKRLLKVENAKRFYEPGGKSLTLAMDFDSLLRWGYVDRNPDTAEFVRKGRQLQADFREPDSASDEELDFSGITVSGITLIGIGGMGKSRCMLRILLHYPQVIIHSHYHGHNRTVKQLVWLKLDCPEGGTRRELLQSFFAAVDKALGTDYFEKYADNGDAKPNKMIPLMVDVVINHGLGVLVIDEFQNLYGSKEGNLTVKFLRRLSNELGIPLVFIGTPDASKVLLGHFSLIRRGSGHGNQEWIPERKRPKVRKNPDDFDVFFQGLSKYVYVKENITPAQAKGLNNTLYEVSGGVFDIAIKIWIAAEKRSIRTGIEKLTSGLLRSVAKDEFPWVQAAVKALKEGTRSALLRYQDLYHEHTRFEKEPGRSLNPPSDHPEPDAGKVGQGAVATETPPTSSRRNQQDENSLLTALVLEGRKNRLSALQALDAAGYIIHTENYLR